LADLDEDVSNYLELANPIAKDCPFLRRSLLSNLLSAVEDNHHRYNEVRLFEIGKVFLKEESGDRADKKSADLLPRQDTHLSFVYTAKHDEVPYRIAFEACQRLGARLGIQIQLCDISSLHLHGGRSAGIFVGDQRLGTIGELQQKYQNNIGLSWRTAVCEINLSELARLPAILSHYTPVPLFPAITRDIAFLVDKNIVHTDIVAHLQSLHLLIQAVTLFDVYEGNKISADKKSMAYRLTYRSNEKTLEAKEVDEIQANVIKQLQKKFGAEVR
jgi:phenylalanyl-tRNA synthetase beta chain